MNAHSPNDRASTSRFRVTRTFVTVVEAEKPFAALEAVRADPDAFDTDIIEHVELLTDETPGCPEGAPA